MFRSNVISGSFVHSVWLSFEPKHNIACIMKRCSLLFIKQFQIKLSPQNVAQNHLPAFYSLIVLTYTHTYWSVYMKCADYFYSFWAIHYVQSLTHEMEDRRVVVWFSAGCILFSTMLKIDMRRIPCPMQWLPLAVFGGENMLGLLITTHIYSPSEIMIRCRYLLLPFPHTSCLAGC
jgi:hypothetical protein